MMKLNCVTFDHFKAALSEQCRGVNFTLFKNQGIKTFTPLKSQGIKLSYDASSEIVR